MSQSHVVREKFILEMDWKRRELYLIGEDPEGHAFFKTHKSLREIQILRTNTRELLCKFTVQDVVRHGFSPKFAISRHAHLQLFTRVNFLH